MSEAFDDLVFDRSTGELRGRGGALALPFTKARLFDALWRARSSGDFVDIGVGRGTGTVRTAVSTLRRDIKRFDLAIEGVARLGRRLRDRRVHAEGAAS